MSVVYVYRFAFLWVGICEEQGAGSREQRGARSEHSLWIECWLTNDFKISRFHPLEKHLASTHAKLLNRRNCFDEHLSSSTLVDKMMTIKYWYGTCKLRT